MIRIPENVTKLSILNFYNYVNCFEKVKLPLMSFILLIT